MTDDIDSWPKAGDRMRFTNAGGWPHENERALKVFELGAVYTVTRRDVRDWSHYVYFEGVKGGWNGCLFTLIEEPEIMVPIKFEGVVEPKTEDGGRALIAEIGDGDETSNMFVRIQSWSDDRQHPEMDSIQGKKVRVTIEVIE